MGKDGTQLLRHCVRLLLVVATDLLSIRQSGSSSFILSLNQIASFHRVCFGFCHELSELSSLLW